MSELLNHDLGVLNELLLALHMSSGNTFPDHFRDEKMSPQVIHDQIKYSIEANTYIKFYDWTYQMAGQVKTRLIGDGLMANTTDVKVIAWTSHRDMPETMGDHEKFTGIKDENSDADIMAETSKGFVGISAKIGVTKDITLRNPGAKTLQKLFGIDDISAPMIGHYEALKHLGFTGTQAEMHEQYKLEKTSARSKLAKASGLRARTDIADLIYHSMVKMKSDEIRNIILELSSPSTYHPHYRTHTRPVKDDVEHHVSHAREHTLKCLDEYSSFDVGYRIRSMAVQIYGTKKYDGSRETVATISIKARSGPMKGWNGVFTAPMLTKKKKKRVLYAFDMDDTLFHHTNTGETLIKVRDMAGNVVDHVTTHQQMSYVLQPGHYYFYPEIEDTLKFIETSRPIQKMIDKMLKLVSQGKKVEIYTARTDFDNVEALKNHLLSFGIDISKVHIRRCGRILGVTSKEAKAMVFSQQIDKNDYDEIHFYDDVEGNLIGFLNLITAYPNLSLIAYHVTYIPATDKLKIKKIKP